MHIVSTVPELRQVIRNWRQDSQRIAFVPTMGNLHEGHLTLANEAKRRADRVVVSIFVNPTQFGPGEDFDNYPRTVHQDQQKLAEGNVDLLFMPSVDDVYPGDVKTTVSVAELSSIYCGASRPGHFDGVATVVCKLFNMVQPDIAVFGLKDFQQLAVIRTMVRDLDIAVDIVGIDTIREASGLAMSSRNGYLTAAEKNIASNLYKSLCEARVAVLTGDQSFAAIENQMQQYLQATGLQPEYFTICRSSDLAKADKVDVDLVILAAAKLGKTRLIDNVYFSKSTQCPINTMDNERTGKS